MRDFAAVQTWMKIEHTHLELQVILNKGLLHWMEFGTHIEIWELDDTPYKEDLENTIMGQHAER